MKLKHLKTINCLIVLSASFLINSVYAQNLKVHYALDSDITGSNQVIDATGNGYDGTLLNSAEIATFDSETVIDLGTSNGYVDLGNQFGSVISELTDFAIVVKMYIPSTSDISGYGNFVWSFANSNDIANDANGCMFFSARNTRYAITPAHYANESGIDNGSQLTKGLWQTVIYVQRSEAGKIYINGDLIVSGDITMTPSELGSTPYNYLGRASYSTDAYLSNAKISDFRVYDAPLSTDQVKILSGISTEYYPTTLLAKFDFDTTQDSAGNYTGILQNGAELVTYGDASILKLGNNDGYFDFSGNFGDIISILDSFSISTNIYIPNSTDISSNGNFIWNFSNSTDMQADANGNMFFRAGNSRYTISETDYSAESTISIDDAFPKGEWINLTYTQREGNGIIYINGDIQAQGAVAVNPKDLGSTPFSFLGRSCYSGDAYLQSAQFDNFIIYQGALKESDVWNLCENLNPLKEISDSLYLLEEMAKLTIANVDSVRSNIILEKSIGDGISVNWETSNSIVISTEGLVNRPAIGESSIIVTLTATFQYKNITSTKFFELTVLPKYSDSESVLLDLAGLEIEGNTSNIRSNIQLPITTKEGSYVVWESDSPEYLNNVGQVFKHPPYGEGKKKVTLTATIIKGDEKVSKIFEVYVAESEEKSSYLFAYFTGNDTNGEQIRFSLSSDGLEYTPLNNGNRIISSDTISIKGGVRDPHILRCEDGNTFYMVVTDMKSAEGWSSNRGMVLLKSNDLINWTHSTVHFPDKWPSAWGNVLRVWAPQTIYDPIAKKYMVYFSLYTNDETSPYDRIYYCYANEDFTDLEGEPQILLDNGTATIDGDIVFNNIDSTYYFFYKNESEGGISQVTGKTLTAAEGNAPGSQWSKPSGKLQQTNKAVEGAGVFRLINTDQWILMYDCYTSGHYQYCISSDLQNFSFVQDNYDISARHGTTIPITDEEMDRLITKWPSSALSPTPLGSNNPRIKQNGFNINTSSKTIDLAANYGTDLTNFNPMLYASSPGTDISPAGEQNFSNGTVSYSFTENGTTVYYNVSVSIEVNPVIPNFHADPEVLYSEKTGRFYIYPTTDGYEGWGGYSFDVFSSPDLINWTNEGTILDLSTDQVSWATGNAWAPCINEVKGDDGNYKYYFYFSGNDGIKKIGVAMANDPAGPFIDSGSPMISEVPNGANGQIIDGDVFTDPVSGNTYFYYGNGFMAVAELNDDMISIKDGTTQIITPSGGTINTYSFREGAYVFYRNGLYYFLWSVDDTGSPNYHVAYGTSSSPTGPINVATEPIVIKQDASNLLYGTAHNSILQIPGRDEWYIVYHRINADYISNGPGYHREVCIDRLFFNEDGTIQQVTPTRRGINPVILNHTATDIKNISKPVFSQFNGEIIKREIYDLTGKIVNSNIKSLKQGIYIIKSVYSNGSIKTYKHIVTTK